MRRRYLVFIAVSCVFFLLAGCQQGAKVATEPAAPEVVEKKGEPKIEFESLAYDFGKVGPGLKLLGEFKFTNTGDDLLKITKVEKCCGAVTKLDKELLAPGESGVLKVQYTSSRMANKIMKRLYVNSNDKANPRATLTIKAETVLKVDWDPRSLRLLLNEENAGCPKITLTSTENKPFSITSFKATNDALTADFDDSVEATQFVLEPKVDIEKFQRNRNGRININLAFPESDTSSETISMYFRVLSRFSVSPSIILFGYNNSEDPITKSLFLRNNYDEEFEIESTSSKEGRIKLLSQRKVDNRYLLDLEITPKADDDTKKITDTFTINLKDGETLEVVCRGTYKPAKKTWVAQKPAPDASVTEGKTAVAAAEPNGLAPKITFENLVCDFGKVRPRIKNTGEFKFTNAGDAPLKITKVERCCGIVTTLEKTEYEPGESGILKVRYTSGRLPNKITKKLYVNSNDKENPRVMLTIQAETVLKVNYEPRHIKLMLMKENAGCPPITIKSVDNKPFSVTGFQATGECLTADIDSSVEATQFVIEPKADMEKLEKSRNGRININLAFLDPDESTETITIYFNALKRFSTSPAMLLLLYDEPGEPVKKTLFITDNHGEQFEVESASSKEGYISILNQEKVGKRYKYELQISTPGEDIKRFKDTFTVNLKGGETLDVPCQGYYKAPKQAKDGG